MDFPTTYGVRQGCVATLNRFNVIVDYWLNSVTERHPDLGVNYHFHISDLCCADDVVLVARVLDILAEVLEVLGEETLPLGLTIRWTKMKLQSLYDCLLPPPPWVISINKEGVESVYLGSKITSN